MSGFARNPKWDDMVKPIMRRCGVCDRCEWPWDKDAGRHVCPHGGPYAGYQRVGSARSA